MGVARAVSPSRKLLRHHWRIRESESEKEVARSEKKWYMVVVQNNH